MLGKHGLCIFYQKLVCKFFKHLADNDVPDINRIFFGNFKINSKIMLRIVTNQHILLVWK